MSNYSKDVKDAIAFVRENVDIDDVRRAMIICDSHRCPLFQADQKLAGQIYDLMEEYGEDNGLSERWWMNEIDEDEILFNLYNIKSMKKTKCWLIESWCEYEDGDLSGIYLRNIFLDEDLARKHFADMFANDVRDGFNPVFKPCGDKVLSRYSYMSEKCEIWFYSLREMEISN